jgi:glycolate oxidase iron-sulfur subunit
MTQNVADSPKTKSNIQTDFQQRMDYNELLNCTRCGFCQPTCPTFIESSGKEASSPRGRIALMKAVVDGFMEPDENFEKELSLCLGCRACETACPSGVKYGQLLEEARDIVNQHKHHSFPIRVLRSLFLEQLLPKQNRLKLLGSLLWLYQRSGIQWIVRKSRLLQIFPGNMAQMESILPSIPSPKQLWQQPKTTGQFLQTEQIQSAVSNTAVQENSLKKRVAFFTGCIMDVMFLETNRNTVHLLKKAGCEIVIPQHQSCCGALHAHAGEKSKARELAKQNIVAFEEEQLDYIITNAGGCGAFLDEYESLFKEDPVWYDRAKRFTGKIKDISEVLLDLNSLPPLMNQEQIVTYQDSCHLKHGMGVDQAPRQLIQAIDGVHFVEMKEADRCCGSAGIYNLVETEMSMQILDHKMEHVKKTEAYTIVTANPGCLLQMKLGIKRAGLEKKMRAVHVVDFLAESLPQSPSFSEKVSRF